MVGNSGGHRGDRGWLFVVAVAVAFVWAGLLIAACAQERQVSVAGTTHFSAISTVDDVTVGDDLTVTDDATVGDALASGKMTVGSWGILSAASVITVTDGGVITPTGTYQLIASEDTVTPTVATNASAGSLLVLVNTTATTINIADSGTMKLSAAAALGQYDSLTLLFDGTNWVELARSNN